MQFSYQVIFGNQKVLVGLHFTKVGKEIILAWKPRLYQNVRFYNKIFCFLPQFMVYNKQYGAYISPSVVSDYLNVSDDITQTGLAIRPYQIYQLRRVRDCLT